MGLDKSLKIKAYLKKIGHEAFTYYTKDMLKFVRMLLGIERPVEGKRQKRPRPIQIQEDPAPKHRRVFKAFIEHVPGEEDPQRESAEEIPNYLSYIVDGLLLMLSYLHLEHEGELTGIGVTDYMWTFIQPLIGTVDELIITLDGPTSCRPPMKVIRKPRKKRKRKKGEQEEEEEEEEEEGEGEWITPHHVGNQWFPGGEEFSRRKGDDVFRKEVFAYLTRRLIRLVRDEMNFIRVSKHKSTRLRRLVFDVSVSRDNYPMCEYPNAYGIVGVPDRSFCLIELVYLLYGPMPQDTHKIVPRIAFLPRRYNQQFQQGNDVCEADGGMFAHARDTIIRMDRRGVHAVVSVLTWDTDSFVYAPCFVRRMQGYNYHLFLVGKLFEREKRERGLGNKKYVVIDVPHLTRLIQVRSEQIVSDKMHPMTPTKTRLADRLRDLPLAFCLLWLCFKNDFNESMGSVLGLSPDYYQRNPKISPMQMSGQFKFENLMKKLPHFLMNHPDPIDMIQ